MSLTREREMPARSRSLKKDKKIEIANISTELKRETPRMLSF